MSIDAIIADHFEMFFQNVPNKSLNELHSRNGFSDELVIFMTIVVEGDSIILFVVGINTRSGDGRTAEISADVFKNLTRITFAWFQVNIEPILGALVNFRFEFFKLRWKLLLKEIQENGLKSTMEEIEIEMSNGMPESILIESTFRKKTMDVRIPLQVTPKGV